MSVCFGNIGDLLITRTDDTYIYIFYLFISLFTCIFLRFKWIILAAGFYVHTFVFATIYSFSALFNDLLDKFHETISRTAMLQAIFKASGLILGKDSIWFFIYSITSHFGLFYKRFLYCCPYVYRMFYYRVYNSINRTGIPALLCLPRPGGSVVSVSDS